ncbi:DUF6350 family protein [Georgenia muralis]|uniref:Uncharacterized protein n=1 Tax=Georgenia muralis TaxID=154117 RepID=A0A3N4Z6H6_9MICO|nr:DUF6350 family protein [Georgenia muralis]RPF27604.1 hypothetical protein EDD32_2092 [Georgenia muralis]
MTTTDTRPPVVIDVPGPQRVRALPEGWLRGLVAGGEAAVLSWLTVVVPAVATYIATAAAPALGEASWQGAARTGTSLWLLGHGGRLDVGGGTVVSLVPLGVALLSLALVHVSTRRMRLTSVAAAALVPVGYVGATALLSLAAAVPAGRAGALAGAALVAVTGAAAAAARDDLVLPASGRVDGAVRDGLLAALWSLAALAAASVVLGAVAVVAGWDRIVMIQQSYGTDVVSTVVLVGAQLVYVPTALVWALAWIAGPGFAVGAGTHFAAASVQTAPLPAVPLLGALPSPGSPGQGWVAVLPVVVGLAAGVWLLRRERERGLRDAAAAALLAGAGTAAVVLLLAAAASGSVGPGRLATVGPDPVLLAATVLAEVGGAALLMVLAAHPRTRAALGAGGSAAWQRVEEHRAARTDRREAVPAVAGPSRTPDGPRRADDGPSRAPAGPRRADDGPTVPGRPAPDPSVKAAAGPDGGAPRPPVWARLDTPPAPTDAGAEPQAPDGGRWSGPRLSQWSATP